MWKQDGSGQYTTVDAVYADGTAISTNTLLYARTFGVMDVKTDTGFLSTSQSLSIADGVLSLTARKLTSAEQSRIGAYNGTVPTHESGLISTEWHFAQAFGYWEVRAKLPTDAQGNSVPGSWSAIWMLPAAYTGTLNGGGQRPEIDVFEHQGGVTTVTSQGNQVTIDRRGKPFSTLHWLDPANGNAETSTPIANATTAIDLTQFHDFGLLWTPDFLATFIDGVEIGRVPNNGRAMDPHYLMVAHDFASYGGADYLSAPLPASLLVKRLRVRALAT